MSQDCPIALQPGQQEQNLVSKNKQTKKQINSMSLEIIQKSTGLEATIYTIVSLAWERHASMQVELELQVPLMEGSLGAE